jgi:hypothetical protein
MTSQRKRTLLAAAMALIAVWILALAGFMAANHFKVTPAKISAYLRRVDFAKLDAAGRHEALRRLAAMLNSLSLEERRAARLDAEWSRWFVAMTDDERLEFMDATLPTGFKQMLASFEQLPEAQRRRSVTDAFRRLRETRERLEKENPDEFAARMGTNGPVLSEELREKAVKLGLQTFYSQSSAQTKAEMAPLLEEVQRSMESGRMFREFRQRPTE